MTTMTSSILSAFGGRIFCIDIDMWGGILWVVMMARLNEKMRCEMG
jgi:hypothetical protein